MLFCTSYFKTQKLPQNIFWSIYHGLGQAQKCGWLKSVYYCLIIEFRSVLIRHYFSVGQTFLCNISFILIQWNMVSLFLSFWDIYFFFKITVNILFHFRAKTTLLKKKERKCGKFEHRKNWNVMCEIQKMIVDSVPVDKSPDLINN